MTVATRWRLWTRGEEPSISSSIQGPAPFSVRVWRDELGGPPGHPARIDNAEIGGWFAATPPADAARPRVDAAGADARRGRVPARYRAPVARTPRGSSAAPASAPCADARACH